MITKAQIQRLFPKAKSTIVDAIIKDWDQAEAAGLITGERISQFFANIGVESGGLTKTEENMNYSAQRLTEVWPGRFKTLKEAKPYANNPQKLAIKVYGGRMGNKAAPSTDGWDYRGGGLMQTTGREGYRKLGYDNNPDALRQPTEAFLSAVREWKNRNLNELADKKDTVAIRKKINGGTHGIDQVKSYLTKARIIFEDYQPSFVDSDISTVALNKGDRGPYVSVLQQNLVKLGYDVGEIDGVFGKGTEDAVKRFQEDHGLTVDGRAGVNTNTAIGERLKDEQVKPKLTAAKRVVNEAAASGSTITKTEWAAAATLIGGGSASIDKATETLHRVDDFTTAVIDMGPWIIVILLVLGGAGYIIYERRKKKNEALKAQAVMEED